MRTFLNGDSVYGIAMTDGVSARSNKTKQKIKTRKHQSVLVKLLD